MGWQRSKSDASLIPTPTTPVCCYSADSLLQLRPLLPFQRYLDKNTARLAVLVPRNSSQTLSALSSLLESHIGSARSLASLGTPCPDLAAKTGTLDMLLTQARDYTGQLDAQVLSPMLANLNTLRKAHADAVKNSLDAQNSLGKEKERDEKTLAKLAWAAETARMDAWERAADLNLEVEALSFVLDGSFGEPGAAAFDQITAGTNVRCGYQQHLGYLSANLHGGALELLKTALGTVCAADRARGSAEVARAESLNTPFQSMDTAGEAMAILDSAGGSGGIEVKRGRGELALPQGLPPLDSADEEGLTYLENRYLRLAAQLSTMSSLALKKSTALPPLPSSPYAIPALSPPPLSPQTLLPASRRLSILQLQLLAPLAALRSISTLPNFFPSSLSPVHNFRPLTLSISTNHCDICGSALLGIGVGTKCDTCGARCHVGACEMRCVAKCPGKGGKTAIEERWKNKRKMALEVAVREAGLRRTKSQSHSRTGSSEVVVSPPSGGSSSTTTASEKTAEALYPYSARTGDELTVEEGESVVLLSPEAGGWIRVRGRQGEGMVPANYLRTGSSSAIGPVSPESSEQGGLRVGARMKMAYAHVPGGEAEVAADEGEEVEIAGVEFVDEGWVRVRGRQGEGLVPASYVV